jgi:hypothetical protein
MWESSRPIRPSRAKSVWSPDSHEWEAEHLWSGAGWQTAAPETPAPPETPGAEPPAPAEWVAAPVGADPEAALARVEEVLAQAMQREGPAPQAQHPGIEGTPPEPTAGELARIEAVLDQTFPRPDEPDPDEDTAFFDVENVKGDLPAPRSPGPAGSPSAPPAPRPDRPPTERGWFLARRPRRGHPPR